MIIPKPDENCSTQKIAIYGTFFVIQGTNKAMNWLKELVEDSQSSLDVLPVSCLCEFLIMGYQERGVVSEAGDEAGPSHRSHFKRKHRGKEKVSIAFIASYFS